MAAALIFASEDSMTTINPARPAVFRADLPVQSQTKFELVIKHQDGKSTRPYRADDAARQRQRGDRVTPSGHCSDMAECPLSGLKADMTFCGANVRF
jgi:hypothetical protein